MQNKLVILVVFALFAAVAFRPTKESKTAKAAVKMQDFVIDISKYSRTIDSNFIVIPQNGPELAFEKLHTSGKLRKSYMDAIDGIAVEDLFYDVKRKIDNYRMQVVRNLQ